MSFVKYQNTNNASSLLIADITASQTTILITDWDQSLFPSKFPFLLTLEHLDASENVILREIVKVVSWNQNSFTVERSAWICVQDDTATNRVQDNTAHAFYSWDRISLYWTAEQVADIQNNLEAKWNQDAIANVYDRTATYAVWDIVVYKGDRYVCQTAVATAEAFDSSKWIKVNIQYELDDQDARITALENAWWSVLQVDVLLVWGWGGWWGGWCYNWNNWWWGWGAWEVIIKQWYIISQKNINIVVWNWWNWGTHWQTGWRWWTWSLSRFWNLIAIWWGWGWWGVGNSSSSNWNWGDWWSWGWVWWFYCSCFASTSPTLKAWTALWLWGHSGWVWYHSRAEWWWGWGAWRPWGKFWLPIAISSDIWSQFMDIWWNWIITNFSWEYRCIWWWWGWGIQSSLVWNIYCNNRHNNSCLSSLNWINNKLYNWAYFGWWTWWYTANNDSRAWWDWKANTWWWGGWWVGNCSLSCGWHWWSWLVIVRYPKDCSYWIACATGWTITTPTINGIQYVVHTFTSWTWTFNITQTT